MDACTIIEVGNSGLVASHIWNGCYVVHLSPVDCAGEVNNEGHSCPHAMQFIKF